MALLSSEQQDSRALFVDKQPVIALAPLRHQLISQAWVEFMSPKKQLQQCLLKKTFLRKDK